MITIVDLEIGNIGSVRRALEYLKIEHTITSDYDEISQANKLILPGVGSFPRAVKNLNQSGLKDLIIKKVLTDKTPILGICLGMQLFAKKGFEFEEADGLGFVSANVLPLKSSDYGLKVPHMGWNNLDNYNLRLTKGIKPDSCFYFVHGFEMVFDNAQDISIAYTDYGTPVVAAFEVNNIFAAQFHPEKSHEAGLTLLKNFNQLLC